MRIGNVFFNGFVFGQAGVAGFFGEPGEHKIHKLFRILFAGFSFAGMVFVSKTATIEARIFPQSSNTELKDGYKLKRWFPKSIWISLRSFIGGYMLNAMGLPNPGFERLIKYNKWQKRKEAFQISFSLRQSSLPGKLVQVREFCILLKERMPFGEIHQYAIQLNESCPNLGHDQKQDPSETIAVLSEFRRLLPNVPLIVKYDLTVLPETIVAVKPYCDAYCIGNSLPFGKLKDEKWWKRLFPKGSPLVKHFGNNYPGGLSGVPLFELLIQWLIKMEKVDKTVVIIAGDGIFTKRNIDRLFQFCIVHGIALGSVASLRPWRLHSLITYGNNVFSKKHDYDFSNM